MNLLKIKGKIKGALCLISIARPTGPYLGPYFDILGRFSTPHGETALAYNLTNENRLLGFERDSGPTESAGLSGTHPAGLPYTRCSPLDLGTIIAYRKKQSYSITQVCTMLFNQIFFLLIIDSGFGARIFGVSGSIVKFIFWFMINYPIMTLFATFGIGLYLALFLPKLLPKLLSHHGGLYHLLSQAAQPLTCLLSDPNSRQEIIWLTYRTCIFLGFMYLKFWYSSWSQVLSYIAMLYMIGWHAQATIYSSEMNIFAPFKRQPATNEKVCAYLFTYELFALDLFLMLFTLFYVVNNQNIVLAFLMRICLSILYIIVALAFLTEYSYITNCPRSNPENPALPFIGTIPVPFIWPENVFTFNFWWPLIAYFFFKLAPKDSYGPLPI